MCVYRLAGQLQCQQFVPWHFCRLGRGSEHIPPALRQLMSPGSPIADLYEVCSDCESLVESIKVATAKLTLVSSETPHMHSRKCSNLQEMQGINLSQPADTHCLQAIRQASGLSKDPTVASNAASSSVQSLRSKVR